MFTGIVEQLGEVAGTYEENGIYNFWIQSAMSSELRIDQSVSHDGICLTIVETDRNQHRVQVIRETIEKTNIGSWKTGKKVNLERSMPANGRFDGHVVQGHVDGTAILTELKDNDGQLLLGFQHAESLGITVSKGSVCINGVSLTVVDSKPDYFSVALIPYTREHTNLGALKLSETVNVEFDILGKYFLKMWNLSPSKIDYTGSK